MKLSRTDILFIPLLFTLPIADILSTTLLRSGDVHILLRLAVCFAVIPVFLIVHFVLQRKPFFISLIHTVILAGLVYATGIVSSYLFPDVYTKYNREHNQERILVPLPAYDVTQIRKLASSVHHGPLLTVSKADCDELPRNSPSGGDGLWIGFRGSRLCQEGDLQMTVGTDIRCGSLCGQTDINYYLIRKTGNAWKIEDDMGGRQLII